MNGAGETGRGRCRACGALLASGQGGEVCPGCALENALGVQPASAAVLPASAVASGISTAPAHLGRLGDYELLEEIARGGMGVVYKARQASLDRLVAVKMLLFGPLASLEYVQRFRTEATAAGSLHHPNIVSIHEVGIHQGQHYLVMDFVNGPPLSRLVADQPLPARRAAGYVKTIAEAIQYAHERGVLHRDLKPSNVLLDENDQPKVTDFGLAKRLEKDSELTLSGQVLGSPSYMAPEQAAAHRGLVGKRSDVYSLGAILYHLLTGRAPFVAPTVAETLQQVQTTDPVSPTILNPHLPRDLKTICLKCLEKEPARRYHTAQELADDLGRWLRREPILARPVSRPEKAWRWCRRNPVVATLAAAAVFIFFLGFAGVAWQGQRATQAAAEAKVQRDLARGRFYAAQMKLAHAAFAEGKLGGALAVLRALSPTPGEPDFRGFDWRYLYGLCLNSPSEVLATNASGFQSADYSPDGRTVALGTGEGFVELFDAQSRQRIKGWQAHAAAIDYLAFYPRNNNWLATVSGDDGILKMWDVTHERLLTWTNTVHGILPGFAFSPGGKFLATRATDVFSIDLWEVQAGAAAERPVLTLRTNVAGFWGPAAFSPDERTLVVCNQIGNREPYNLALYDLATGVLNTNFPLVHRDFIISVAFSPDGLTLATGGGDERVVLWEIKGQKAILTNRSDFVVVTSVAFTPDSRTLLASSWGQNLLSWNIDDPIQRKVWQGHSAAVNRLVMAPDGRAFVTASSDSTARLWPLATTPSAPTLTKREEFSTLLPPRDIPAPESAPPAIFGVAVAPTQDRAVATQSYRLVLCDLGTGIILNTVAASNVLHTLHDFGRMTFSPDGRTLAVTTYGGAVCFLDALTLRLLREPLHLHADQITHLAYALNGTVLVTGGGFGSGIKLTHVASGTNYWEIPDVPNSFPVEALAVSPDGKLLAAAGTNHSLLVWDIATRRVAARSPQDVRFLHDVAFAPDGKLLAIADERGAIFLWDFTGHRPLRKLVGHTGPVNMLAFSPDGRTLASAGMDHTIRLWRPEVDQEVAILKGHTGWVWCVAFAEHGNALLSGSSDGTLKLWQALSFEEIRAQPMAEARHR